MQADVRSTEWAVFADCSSVLLWLLPYWRVPHSTSTAVVYGHLWRSVRSDGHRRCHLLCSGSHLRFQQLVRLSDIVPMMKNVCLLVLALSGCGTTMSAPVDVPCVDFDADGTALAADVKMAVEHIFDGETTESLIGTEAYLEVGHIIADPGGDTKIVRVDSPGLISIPIIIDGDTVAAGCVAVEIAVMGQPVIGQAVKFVLPGGAP